LFRSHTRRTAGDSRSGARTPSANRQYGPHPAGSGKFRKCVTTRYLRHRLWKGRDSSLISANLAPATDNRWRAPATAGAPGLLQLLQHGTGHTRFGAVGILLDQLVQRDRGTGGVTALVLQHRQLVQRGSHLRAVRVRLGDRREMLHRLVWLGLGHGAVNLAKPEMTVGNELSVRIAGQVAFKGLGSFLVLAGDQLVLGSGIACPVSFRVFRRCTG